MRRIVVHVDRLVLKGFTAQDQRRFAENLEDELGRLLAKPVAVERLSFLRHALSIRVLKGDAPQGPMPASPGISAARAIAKGLCR